MSIFNEKACGKFTFGMDAPLATELRKPSEGPKSTFQIEIPASNESQLPRPQEKP